MAHPVLGKKPLVEAIFELRWDLRDSGPGPGTDPHYQLFVGRLYDRVLKQYPHHEQLPAAAAPPELASHVVQHRFRKAANEWPLLQVGPGVVTLNATTDYDWADYEKRIAGLLDAVHDAYPKDVLGAGITMVLLRYLDAFPLDLGETNACDYLEDKLKTRIKLERRLFEKTGVAERPSNIDLRFEFFTTTPPGIVQLKFARGRRKTNGTDVIMLDTTVRTGEKDIPQEKTPLLEWTKAAHDLADDWFFKLVEGELLESFK
jgi:uncharacterized protein (TIGR04255 family)